MLFGRSPIKCSRFASPSKKEEKKRMSDIIIPEILCTIRDMCHKHIRTNTDITQ